MWYETTKTGKRLCERTKINDKWKRITVTLSKDTAKGRKQAEDALREKIAKLSEPTSSIHLKDAIEEYLATKDCRSTTMSSTKSMMYTALEIIGDVRVSSITTGTLRRCFQASDKSNKTRNYILRSFHTFLVWCAECEIIPSVPMMPRFKDDSPRKKSEEKYLEADELKDVLSQMSGMMYYVSRFLALTGCRISEACNLYMDDISEAYIAIREGKTSASVREIYIQPELKEMLSEYKQWRALNLMATGIRTDRLFYTKNGTPYSALTYRQLLLKHIKCEKHLHPHIFRHTHVALLAEQGMSLEAISRRLGHESSSITKEVYYHVTEKQKKKDEEQIAAIRIL